MARPKTAQPNHSLRKVAAVVATAVSGMSVYAQAAEQPKQEETITVVAAPAAQESAWGPAPTIAAKRSATATKTDTPIEKTPQSVSVVTRQEMEMRQPTTVKEALSYTPASSPLAAVRPPMTWSPFAASPPRRPSTPTSIWTA